MSSLKESSGYKPPNRSLALTSPVQPALRSKIKSQSLRKQLQNKMVDLGSLQSDWTQQESSLRNKSEDLVTQLRDCQRQFEATKNADRVKHLQILDQLNKQHQIIVLDLQSQIDDCIEGKNDLDDCADIDQEIENVRIQIAGFQTVQAHKNEEEEDDREEIEHNKRIEMIEERLNEMRNMYEKAVQQREEESKTSTVRLEELILNQQNIDERNNLEIQQLVDELNNLDREQRTQISTIEKQVNENKRQIANNLKSTTSKLADIQQKITKIQHDHKKEMHRIVDEETQYRNVLESLNARHRGYLEESSNAARKSSEEKRRFAAMQHEVEELNGELVRESIEHETLIKEVSKMDNEVLNQMSTVITNDRSLSFSFNRF